MGKGDCKKCTAFWGVLGLLTLVLLVMLLISASTDKTEQSFPSAVRLEAGGVYVKLEDNLKPKSVENEKGKKQSELMEVWTRDNEVAKDKRFKLGSEEMVSFGPDKGFFSTVQAAWNDDAAGDDDSAGDDPSVLVEPVVCPPACTSCAGEVCTIDCNATSACQGAALLCPPFMECDVQCGGISSCQGASIRCPDQGSCNVSCSNTSSCQSMFLTGSGPDVLTLDCSGTSACQAGQAMILW